MQRAFVLLAVCLGWLAGAGPTDAGGDGMGYAELGYHGGDPYYRSYIYGPAGGVPPRRSASINAGYYGSTPGHVDASPVPQFPRLVATCCHPAAQCCGSMKGLFAGDQPPAVRSSAPATPEGNPWK